MSETKNSVEAGVLKKRYMILSAIVAVFGICLSWFCFSFVYCGNFIDAVFLAFAMAGGMLAGIGHLTFILLNDGLVDPVKLKFSYKGDQ